MRDYLLFVDTETSGIPKDIDADLKKTDQWPFILQLAWRIYTPNGKLIKEENRYIYEPEIVIQKSSSKIHGINLEVLKSAGEERKQVIKSFAKDLRYYKPLIVGHFVEFDSKMLQVAFYRCRLKNIVKTFPHFCTMRSTTEYTRFVNRDYPRLNELYENLFREKLEHQHDASVDASATARCFFELYKRGEFDEELIKNQRLFSKVKQEMSNKYGCGLPAVLFVIIGLLFFFL